MNAKKRFFSLFQALVWAVMLTGLMAASAWQPVLGQEAPYQEPNLSANLFEAEKIEFAAEEKERLTDYLTKVARNLEVSNRVKAKALALALRLEPTKKEAFVANYQLKRGETPEPLEGPADPAQIANFFWEYGDSLRAFGEDNPDALKLAGFLMDMAVEVDPDNVDRAYALAMYKQEGNAVDWGLTMPVAAAAKTSMSSMKVPATPGGKDAELARTQSLIKGLLVRPLEGSRYAGKASQMNATATETGGNQEMKVDFNQEVGDSMHSALNEVVKYLRVRHGRLPSGYEVEISFEEQYIPKDGPSAAVACSLLLESLISGMEIDENFAVTGDLNADGTVQPVGGVDGKIRGATKRDCNVIAIPSQNVSVVSDLLLMSGPAAITNIQVFSIETFEQAAALAQAPEKRSEDLQKAIDSFTEIQEVLHRPNGFAYLKNAKVQERLREVVKLAPNHQSAIWLLYEGLGRSPDRLTLQGSLIYIDRAAEPLIRAIRQGKFDAQSPLDGDEYADSAYALRRLRNKLDNRTVDLADAIISYASLMRTFVNDRPNSYNKLNELISEIRNAGSAVSRAYDDLYNRVDVQEELMQ